MNIKALAFDTGGTVSDWRGGLVAALSGIGASHGLAPDWHAVVNDWRRRAMKGIVGQTQPAFNMDDVHRRTLDESLEHFGLQAFSPVERDQVWRTWYALDTWPDIPAALTRPAEGTSGGLVHDAAHPSGRRRVAQERDRLGRRPFVRNDRRLPAAGADPDGGSPQLRPRCRAQGGVPHSLRSASGRTGPAGPPDSNPNMGYDIVVSDFDALVQAVLSSREPDTTVLPPGSSP